MCFVDLEKAFDRSSWALWKKGLQEILVKVIMSLYESSKTKVKVGSELSEECYVTVGVHQGSIFSLLMFAVIVDVVTEEARKSLMKEVLFENDLVLMSKTMEGLKERFQKKRSALENKGRKVNLEKTKVMLCESDGEAIPSRIDPC